MGFCFVSDGVEKSKKSDRPRRLARYCAGFLTSVLFGAAAYLLVLPFPGGMKDAFACACVSNTCPSSDCSSASNFVNQRHDEVYDRTTQEFDDDLAAFEDWMIDSWLEQHIIPAMGLMANQMGAVGMQFTQAIGSFLDAQNQLETHQLIQKLKHVAHRDYHVSEGMCTFGTNVRSLAASSTLSDMNASGLSTAMLDRQLGVHLVSGSQSVGQDLRGRWNTFIRQNCNIRDNNRIRSWSAIAAGAIETPESGLALACDHDGGGGSSDMGAEESERYNKDIDYTRLIEEPRTLEADFSNDTLDNAGTFGGLAVIAGDEEDVLSMSKNLYGHHVLTRTLSRKVLASSDTAARLYLGLRSIAAKRSVAQYSFSAIVGLKSRGSNLGIVPSDMPPVGFTLGGYTLFPNAAYMAAVMREIFPVTDNNTTLIEDCDPSGGPVNNACIYKLIGMRPSYFSQLEILAKRIYQNPTFYAELYESAANVERKKVAMRAVELMVDREIYESQLRKEMVVSVLLASKLVPSVRESNAAIAAAKQ